MIDLLAREETEYSRMYARDEKARVRHHTAMLRALKTLSNKYKAVAKKTLEAAKKVGKTPSQAERIFTKHLVVQRDFINFAKKYIGEGYKGASSRTSACAYVIRNVHFRGLSIDDEIARIAPSMQHNYRDMENEKSARNIKAKLGEEFFEFLPDSLVVETDKSGKITKLYNRFREKFENLGEKIEVQKELVANYAKIRKSVLKDLKSADSSLKIKALVVSILMETGIRPGEHGNQVYKSDTDEYEETFGAITLMPKHIKFVRANVAQLKFVGKRTTVNIAELRDAQIVKVLKDMVGRVSTKRGSDAGSKFIFVFDDGKVLTQSIVNTYLKKKLRRLRMTDFRKLKATRSILESLKEEQADLYVKVGSFKALAKKKMKQEITTAVLEAVQRAYAKSQQDLSHRSVKTTYSSYINPQVLLRFLSEGAVEDNLEDLLTQQKTELRFDPEVFLTKALQSAGGSPKATKRTKATKSTKRTKATKSTKRTKATKSTKRTKRTKSTRK